MTDPSLCNGKCSGDVLLLQGEHEAMPEAFASLGCLPLAERDLAFSKNEKSIATPVIFVRYLLEVSPASNMKRVHRENFNPRYRLLIDDGIKEEKPPQPHPGIWTEIGTLN